MGTESFIWWRTWFACIPIWQREEICSHLGDAFISRHWSQLYIFDGLSADRAMQLGACNKESWQRFQDWFTSHGGPAIPQSEGACAFWILLGSSVADSNEYAADIAEWLASEMDHRQLLQEMAEQAAQEEEEDFEEFKFHSEDYEAIADQWDDYVNYAGDDDVENTDDDRMIKDTGSDDDSVDCPDDDDSAENPDSDGSRSRLEITAHGAVAPTNIIASAAITSVSASEPSSIPPRDCPTPPTHDNWTFYLAFAPWEVDWDAISRVVPENWGPTLTEEEQQSMMKMIREGKWSPFG